MTKKDIIQLNMMYNMATTKTSKSLENVKPMKCIFDLQLFIKHQSEQYDELPSFVLESITGWAKDINGQEVVPFGNIYRCGCSAVLEKWTKEVER